MVTLFKMIIIWWLFIDFQFPFDFVISNVMVELKRIYRTIEAFETENTRSCFKCCNSENRKTICQATANTILQFCPRHCWFY